MYEQLYHLMFNAVTDALAAMDALNYGQAGQILRHAQSSAEEVYLDAGDDDKD